VTSPSNTTAARTLSLPIQTIDGFEPGLREVLREALSPLPAAEGSLVAISYVILSSHFKQATFLWSCDEKGGLADTVERRFASKALEDQVPFLGFAIDIDNALSERPMRSPTLEYKTSARHYEMVCLPQGVIYFAKHPVRELEKLARRQGVREIDEEMVRAVFEVVEGAKTSNHERLELIGSATAFLKALLAREYAAAEGLTHHPVELCVQARA